MRSKAGLVAVGWTLCALCYPVNAQTGPLVIRGATRHNLRKLDADLPLGLFLCLTGVSGSGKSTFAHDVIYQNLARKLGQQPVRVERTLWLHQCS